MDPSQQIQRSLDKNKKLLVIGLKGTILSAKKGNSEPRPYLGRFLEELKEKYNILIWGAGSREVVEAQCRENEIIASSGAINGYIGDEMTWSTAGKKGKPLKNVWGIQISNFNMTNTIHVDCDKAQAVYNPREYLPVDLFVADMEDQELRYLTLYLKRIATMSDFTTLNHRHWRGEI